VSWDGPIERWPDDPTDTAPGFLYNVAFLMC
jgi:hypothetical protein